MSNFQESFRNWQEKMNKKTDEEKHRYAMLVSIIVTLIVFFLLASNWYFRISGEPIETSFFTDIEKVFNDGKANFSNNN